MVSRPPFQRLGIECPAQRPRQCRHGTTATSARWLSTSTLALTGSGRVFPAKTPATGVIDGTYTQRDGAVDLRNFELTLPASHLAAHGRVGAYPLTSPTSLNVDFHTGNLSEFDTILRALGVARNGKSGVAALPVGINGQADFRGNLGGLARLAPLERRSCKRHRLRRDAALRSGRLRKPQAALGHHRGRRQLRRRTHRHPARQPTARRRRRSSWTARSSRDSARHRLRIPGVEARATPSFDSNSVLHLHARAQGARHGGCASAARHQRSHHRHHRRADHGRRPSQRAGRLRIAEAQRRHESTASRSQPFTCRARFDNKS